MKQPIPNLGWAALFVTDGVALEGCHRGGTLRAVRKLSRI